MKSAYKSFVAVACLALTLGTQAQSTPPTDSATKSSTPTAPARNKLGSKALGTMDPRATQAMESIGRTNSSLAALVAGAGAAVAPQSGTTAMDSGLSTPSIVAIGLAGLALSGGGGGGGSTGTTPR
jgi:hypothetical protein